METIKNHFSAAILFLLVWGFAADVFAQGEAALPKVHHAEPLYMDLVRDLGARKGEKEINIGTELKDRSGYNQYTFLAEYEFAPINRLGLEVEADFNFFKSTVNGNAELPGNKLEGLRFSSQYSFLVSTKYRATLAVGYTQILELTDFNDYGKTKLVSGTVFNPFFVAAKRWGKDFHSLVYTYPLIERHFATATTELSWGINTSLFYSIPETKHFVGVELNKEIDHGHFGMTIRPQAKIRVNEHLAVGMVTGFPVHRSGERFSSFFRLIYEP
ncbi:phosphoribosylformylglycinamidine synthase [Algoriphagus sp. H41]|uniref:Phosphoribosylformylglycinamidine synthase n=1 Tax=Algoriphagus oliviformis TaxID=2811231 RepID=A0ABS3CAB2_9BACT|nr:HAEPLYID family protein [Algoriphagus oliviformis]MBN7813115.1 phosphoribosylformylglycinamidine synthase [Algoriphagus oliviformis]